MVTSRVADPGGVDPIRTRPSRKTRIRTSIKTGSGEKIIELDQGRGRIRVELIRMWSKKNGSGSATLVHTIVC